MKSWLRLTDPKVNPWFQETIRACSHLSGRNLKLPASFHQLRDYPQQLSQLFCLIPRPLHHHYTARVVTEDSVVVDLKRRQGYVNTCKTMDSIYLATKKLHYQK